MDEEDPWGLPPTPATPGPHRFEPQGSLGRPRSCGQSLLCTSRCIIDPLIIAILYLLGSPMRIGGGSLSRSRLPAGSHPYCPQCALPSVVPACTPFRLLQAGWGHGSSVPHIASFPGPHLLPLAKSRSICRVSFSAGPGSSPGRASSATRLGSRLACRRARPRRSKHSLLPMPFPF